MNGHANIDTVEATEHLKNILNVGKSESETVKLKSISNGNMELSGEGNNGSHDESYQKIDLCANKDCSHKAVYGTDVDVYSSPLEYGATCSQVIVEDMVVYCWEDKYYTGKLISIHLSGLYIAYVIKLSPNKPGCVRILRTQLDLRHLIKDYKFEVKDVAFAHTTSQVLLGSVDACGELLVHKISDDGFTILCDLLLRIIRPEDWTPSAHNRIIWCLYIPDDIESEEDENFDAVSTLVVTHNEKAEIWNIGTVTKEHGNGSLTMDEVKKGVQVISDHQTPISAATFSPDGTALAIGSTEGVVKFFQVNILEKGISPRCLHQWIPHPNKSLSSLYFLDNHKNHRPDVQFWKIAVTGADNNTEIKVWSCESWTCLQTIRIHPNPDDSIVPCLKAEIDLSSKYLFLSDIKRKVLLILHMQHDPVPSNVVVSAISEYRVPLPVLSLAISSINFVKFHSEDFNNSDDEGDKELASDALNDEDESVNKYIIKLFWIQSKSLQSCRILYKPKFLSPMQSIGSVSSLSHDSYAFKDGLSDISMDSRDLSSRSVKDLDMSLPKGLCGVEEHSLISQSSPASLTALPPHISNYPKCAEVLLTPDDFTSPSHSNLSAQNSFSLHEDLGSSASKHEAPARLSDGIESLPVEPNTLQRRKSSQHSAASSPSREVAEILAPTKVLHLDEMTSEASADVTKDEKTVTNTLGSFNVSGSSGTTRNQPDYMKEWPQAPDPTKDYRLSARKDCDLQGHSQLYRSDSGEPSNFSHAMNNKISELNGNFVELMRKLDSFTDALRDQRCDIQSLQSEIKLLRQDQKLNHPNLKDNILLNKLEHVNTQNYSRLENLMLKRAEDERRRAERDLALLSEEVSETFGAKLENTLKQELSSSIVPQINRVLDAIAQKMQLDFSQKLSATDTSLRDSFIKYLKGKAFTDCLTLALTSSLHGTVQSACKDVFQSSVIPSFDKSCQQLFQQMNDQFSRGTHEYLQFLEKHSQKSTSAIDGSVAFLKEEVNKLITGAQQAIHSQAIKTENQNQDVKKQHDALLSDIREVVQVEIKKALREQTNAVLNSRSTTPVPYSDPQVQKQHLMQLVKQGNINEAFQQALSVIDVQLVMFLCESVNLDLVFGPTPCPLQQHVLLSLLHQLSSDLFTKTELKLKYIEDVMASLDRDDPIIKEHIHVVLNDLLQRINQFQQQYPNHRLSRNLKRLSFAANSLLKR